MADNYAKFAIRIEADPETAEEEFKWLKLYTKKLNDGKAVFGHSGFAGWRINRHEAVPTHIEVYSDNTFDHEGLAVVLMNFLKKFHDDVVLKVEWAMYCSTPRVGEFGGGAFVVSPDGFEFFHTTQWASRKQSEWQELLTGDELGLDDTIDLDDDEEF